MNKAIYIFAYLFLLLAGAALFFEIQLIAIACKKIIW